MNSSPITLVSLLLFVGGSVACIDVSGLSDFEVKEGGAGGAAGGPSSGGGNPSAGGGGAGGACTNNALELNGSDNYAIVADHPDLDIGDAFTVEAWVRPDADFNNDEMHLLSHSNFGSNLGWSFMLRDRVVEFRVHDGGALHRCIGTQMLNPEEWTHIAGVYRDTQIVCAVNGVGDMVEPLGTPITPLSYAGDLHIGASVGGDQFFYGGLIDDIRISNVARTMTGLPTSPPMADADTVALWRFEGTGDQLIDDTDTHHGVRSDPPGGQPPRVTVPCDAREMP